MTPRYVTTTEIVIRRVARWRWEWSASSRVGVKRGKNWFRWSAWWDARMHIGRVYGRMDRWEALIMVEEWVGESKRNPPDPIPAKLLVGDE
jgi:hypothetical protein